MTKKDKQEILFWQKAKRLLERDYGQCKVMDYEDFPKQSHELNGQGRCSSCQATEVCYWIERQIKLIKDWQ